MVNQFTLLISTLEEFIWDLIAGWLDIVDVCKIWTIIRYLERTHSKSQFQIISCACRGQLLSWQHCPLYLRCWSNIKANMYKVITDEHLVADRQKQCYTTELCWVMLAYLSISVYNSFGLCHGPCYIIMTSRSCPL